MKKRGKGHFGQVWASQGYFGQVQASLGKFGQVWTSLGKFGQVWASLGKFGQVRTSQDKANGKEEAERIRKGNKNLSGQGGEEGEGEGETRVQNSPKAFGELITIYSEINGGSLKKVGITGSCKQWGPSFIYSIQDSKV